MLKDHCVPSLLEPKNVLCNSNLVPDGISFAPFKRGKCLIWDVGVAHPTAESHVELACKERTALVSKVESLKVSKYSALTPEFEFVLLVVETFGSVGKEFLKLIK